MGDDEEDGKIKPRKMDIEDAFMQHPESGGFVRNPLREKAKSQPILLSISEFNHNVLDDTLGDWHMVTVGETSFRDLMSHYADTHGSSMPLSWSRTVSLQSRCSVGRVHALGAAFDFIVQIRKSTYVAPRKKPPRPGERKDAPGVTIDKLNMEVSSCDERSLRVENITEGLILVWNRAHPAFTVKIGDIITSVNLQKRSAHAMIEELQSAPDLIRMTVKRPAARPASRAGSRAGSRTVSKQDARSMSKLALAGGETMLPTGYTAGSLVKPEGEMRRKPSMTKLEGTQ